MNPAHPYALSDSEVAAYRSKSFVVVRGRFSAEEIAAWRTEAERVWALPRVVEEDNLRVEKRSHLSSPPVMDRLDPVLDLSPLFLALARSPKVLGAVDSILGAGSSVFRCKLIMKRPGTCGYDLHQDYPYWEALGVPADDMLTCAVAIDGAAADSGAMELVPAATRRFPGRPDEPRDLDPSCVDLGSVEMPELAAGDLLLFHSLAPHRSGPNRSEGPRRVLLPSFVGPRHGDLYDAYNDDFIARKMKAGGAYR
jgi:ectoine hydroxylase-related dioxygenase (phytanoyl-CoA dioxygenase family)